jgi:hypothetical protein
MFCTCLQELKEKAGVIKTTEEEEEEEPSPRPRRRRRKAPSGPKGAGVDREEEEGPEEEERSPNAPEEEQGADGAGEAPLTEEEVEAALDAVIEEQERREKIPYHLTITQRSFEAGGMIRRGTRQQALNEQLAELCIDAEDALMKASV